MNIDKILSPLLISFLILLLLNTVNSQGPFPYNTKTGCSVNTLNSSYAIQEQYQPFKNVTIAPGTCQKSHPDYSDESCCTNEQSIQLFNNMVIGDSIFEPCPSCLYNMWDLFCAFTCSPFQESFIVPTKVGNLGRIIKIDFILHPDYAQGLYDSCKGINEFGSPPFGELFPTYQQFFSGIFYSFPTFNLNWVYNTTGYSGNIIGCAESCSCDQCSDACTSSSSQSSSF